MSSITWLHLSDLHFRVGEQHTWNENIVLQALLDDVRACISENVLIPDLILVSGDIAFSGAPSEYVLARQFFDTLLEIVDLPKTRLFVVPGNHDVDRQAISRGAEAIASSLGNRQAVNEVLSVAVDRRLVFRRFDGYASFVNDFFAGNLIFDNEHYFYVQYVRPLDLVGKRVAVLGLNSAWLAYGGDEDRSRLALGERQVRQALDAARDADLRIALLHHPFDWFQEFDRNDCEALLMQGCDFVLHGHLHRTGLLSLTMPDAGAMIVAAGACYESRTYPNSYNLVQLDFKAGRGTIHLRRYSDERGGFWTKDVMTYRNVDDGQYPFAWPSSQGKRPSESRHETPAISIVPSVDSIQLEKTYLRRVMVSSNALPLAIIDPRAVERTRQPTMDLLAVYVALNTQTLIAVAGEEDEDKKKGQGPERAMIETNRETRPLTALEAAAREKHMVLLGDTGSGKSTFASYLALCLAGGRLERLEDSSPPSDGWLAHLKPTWGHGPLLPLQVVLRHFARSAHCDGTAAGLWRFVTDTLTAQDLADWPPYLRQQLLAGGVIVLLDGLDEVAEPEKRQAVRDAVADFAATYSHPDNRYLVTCRGYAYQDPCWQLERFVSHTLAPFNQEQIGAFIGCWYREVCRLGWKDATEAEDLTRQLRAATRRPDLACLAESPLQLMMMASLHFSWGRLPDDRVELYQEMVRLLLVRWQEARLGEGEGVSQMVGAGDLESALERVAFVAHRAQEGPEGTADISEEVLRSVLRDYLEGSWDRAGELVTYMKERAGLLLEREPRVYTFPHRSYQEYLAGSYLAVQPDFPDEAARLIGENYGQWREVVLWAVGVMARLKKMIHVAVDVAAALCPREVAKGPVTESDWQAAHLAGEALLEIGLGAVRARERYEQVLARVKGWLIDIPKRDELPVVERAVAGNTLAQLGDPRFRAEAWYLPDEPLLGFVEVPAGPFLMGTQKEKMVALLEKYGGGQNWREREVPQHSVDLPGYYIGRYAVTVAQFRAFVEASGHEPRAPDSLWLLGIANHPVVWMSWYDATAYCRWLTEQLRAWDETPEPLARLLRVEGWAVRLPTEAEWEKAARGTDGREFPWGSETDANLANCDDTGIGGTSAVGCFPGGVSPYGAYDMSGNVLEWCQSLYKSYPYRSEDGREDTNASGVRVVRGGSFLNHQYHACCACRYTYYPRLGWRDCGFRVVVSPISPISAL